jgi:hypothetical protein
LQAGEYLASGEMKDYCRLTYELRNEISPECVCILDGINWDNPPKSSDFLSEDWELLYEEKSLSNRLKYRLKKYPKIIIGFDSKDRNGNENPHWHRENPNGKKFPYLDKYGKPTARNTPHSHIYVKSKK